MNALTVLILLSLCLGMLYFGSVFVSDYADHDSQNPLLHYMNENKITDKLLSWNIDDKNDIKFSDSLTINQDLKNSIHFNGKSDFVSFKSHTSSDVSNFSLLVFVKPNFNNANDMTIIEHKDCYRLTLNDNGGYHAKFSIFDGNQWISISSPIILKEKWTSIFAKFDGSSISLLVNDANLVKKQLDVTNSIYGISFLHLDHENILGASKSTEGFN